MSLNGTSMYAALDDSDVPDLVRRAVAAAEELGFELCVHPATGRLLQSIAGGVAPGGLIGETGTGTGAGLAWMASRVDPTVSLVSAEVDADRVAAARLVFVDVPNVTILHADAGEVFDRGPYDLLVHDGGWGSGKSGDDRVDVGEVLKEGGLMTIDDLSPFSTWPPMFRGAVDEGRAYWLTHPAVLATEIPVAESMSVVVARRTTR